MKPIVFDDAFWNEFFDTLPFGIGVLIAFVLTSFLVYRFKDKKNGGKVLAVYFVAVAVGVVVWLMLMPDNAG